MEMIDKNIFQLCESCQDETELKNLDRNRYKANLKFDGERCIAIKKGEDIILLNRRGNIISYKFNEIVEALKKINSDFIIDGELISFDNKFNSLQRRALTKDINKIKQLEKEIPIKFMVFDILSNENQVLMSMPLRERLIFLYKLFENNDYLEIAEYGEIDNMLMIAIENDGEGVVIKDLE